MTKAKDPAAKQKPGRKPGPLIPCGACFALLSAREWKGHHAHCPDREDPRLTWFLGHVQDWSGVRVLSLAQKSGKHAVWLNMDWPHDAMEGRRIGPWRDTPLEAVRDCPRGKR